MDGEQSSPDVAAVANSAVATQPVQTTTPSVNNETRTALPTAESVTQVESGNGFNLPDAYKDKGWAKNIKSIEDLAKAHDNAQSLIGKKTIGIPEDWNDEKSREEFLSKVRPKTAEDYAIETKPEIKEACYKFGLSPFQAEGLAKSMQEISAVEFSKEGFEKEMSGVFGGDTATAAKSAQYIKQVLGDDAAVLDTFTNKQLSVIYKLGKQGLSGMPSEGKVALQGSSMATARPEAEIMKDLRSLDSKPNGYLKKPSLLAELELSRKINKGK